MPNLASKYKMLWFAVDRHHRQRYFCNCDCKQTVTLSPVADRKAEKPAVLKKPPFFRSLYHLTPQFLAALRPRDRYFKNSPMERNR